MGVGASRRRSSRFQPVPGAALDSRGGRGPLLRNSLDLEGLSPRRRVGRECDRRRALALERGGELPIVVDATSCTHGLLDTGPLLDDVNRERHRKLEILDSIAWAHDRLLPQLEISRKVDSAVVHPTCSTRQLGLVGALEQTARALADDVIVPAESTCCGFAGDRGFLHPELTAAATRREAEEVKASGAEAHLSSNRTCEIGLERATGEGFESFVYLLEELTRS